MIVSSEAKARDLMQTDLVTLHVATPIREAVESFEEYRISGAPVLNEAGELVGVLSASDIVRSEHVEDAPNSDREDASSSLKIGRAPDEYYAVDPFWGDNTFGWDEDSNPFGREDYNPETIGRETVGDWMTNRVICVSPDTALPEIAALIAKERIHRVFVVDDLQLQGVVSTLDIVSFLADSTR